MSEYARPVYGRSGLTDDERQILVLITLRHVANELAITEQDAADLLDAYAETGDSRICGDQRWVSIVVDGQELVRVERAWLRAVAHRGAPALN